MKKTGKRKVQSEDRAKQKRASKQAEHRQGEEEEERKSKRGSEDTPTRQHHTASHAHSASTRTLTKRPAGSRSKDRKANRKANADLHSASMPSLNENFFYCKMLNSLIRVSAAGLNGIETGCCINQIKISFLCHVEPWVEQ